MSSLAFRKKKISNFFLNFMLESINMFLTRFIFLRSILWGSSFFLYSRDQHWIQIFVSRCKKAYTISSFPDFSKIFFLIFSHPSFLAFVAWIVTIPGLNVFIELIKLSSIVLFTYQHTFSNKTHHLKRCLTNDKGFF